MSRYVKEGKIRAIRLPNRTLNYNEDDVYSMAGKSKVRMNRLARLSYDLAEKLIVQNHGRIELINAAEKTDEQELFEDLMQVVHSFSMKMYSRRRLAKKLCKE